MERYKEQIQQLCENHRVETLYSFGSVNTPRFSKDSDVDLMVDFKTKDPLEYTDLYFALKFELEGILKRQVDLLENRAITNPFLRQSIDNSKILIYGH